ncbi:MAG: Stk1 family PASTA domain-containing Ser/Thr kinase [Actinomycetota bacterium]
MAQPKILNERYEIESTLGEGGMARVYRGTDGVLGRPVAIKVLADRYANDDTFVTRFRREAQAAAALNHPNVVSVFDTGDDGQAHYIVMEYVPGHTLADVLKREGPLDPDRAARIAENVATALQAAHERGLVHRDVKPGNVMIDPQGRTKVMDFGIARAATDDTLTQTGAVLGTAAYLSPEQARGDPVDARSDIYSLGCVLYEMLTGRPPFTGDSPVAIAYAHVNDQPDPPSAHRPGIPPDLEAVTMKALAKDPADRYGSAGALHDALAAARAAGVPTEPIGAAAGDTAVMPVPGTTAPVSPEPAGPPRRMSWIPLALIAAAVLAVAGILALTLAGDGARPRNQGGGQDRSQPEQAAPEQESPAPPAEIPAPDEALGAFEDLLVASVGDGTLTFKAAEKIGSKANDAGDKYFEGDLEGALAEVEAARKEADKAASQGEITSEETLAALHQGLDVVAASMEAAPPEVATEEGDGEGDEESSGPGNSENAPGREKKDGDEGEG